MKRLTVFAAVLLFALAVSSCTVVPLDLDLITAHNRGLTVEGMVGPIDKFGNQGGLTDAVFIPDVTSTGGIDAQNGFLVYSSFGSRQLTYAAWNASAANYHKVSSDQFIGSSSDTYQQVNLHSTKGAAHLVEGFQWGDPARLRGVIADLTLGTITGVVDVNLRTQHSSAAFTPPFSGNAIGASVLPLSDPARDQAFVLAREDATQNYMEYSLEYSAAGWAGMAYSRLAAPYDLSWLLPVNLDRVLYYYSPGSTRSYACWFDASTSTWRTFTWTDTAAGNGTELTAVNHRVDALLTTGELFSVEGGTARVYGGVDGGLLASFDLAGMNFVEERYVNGVARLLFSRPMVLDDAPWFVLYSIPTADVKSLSGK